MVGGRGAGGGTGGATRSLSRGRCQAARRPSRPTLIQTALRVAAREVGTRGGGPSGPGPGIWEVCPGACLLSASSQGGGRAAEAQGPGLLPSRPARLVREEAGEGLPQVADGLGLGLVLTRGPALGGVRGAEAVGQGLGFAARERPGVAGPRPRLPRAWPGAVPEPEGREARTRGCHAGMSRTACRRLL